jgi:hypothetical protein
MLKDMMQGEAADLKSLYQHLKLDDHVKQEVHVGLTFSIIGGHRTLISI